MLRNFSYLSYLIAVMIFLPSISESQSHSSKTTEFYIGYMENLDLSSNGPPTFSLVIGAAEATTGTISFPATGYVQNFSVGAATALEIFLPAAIYYPQGDEAYSNAGMKVVSDHPISIYSFHNRLYFSEATLVLPSNELGTDYIAACHGDDGESGSGSELVIEATEDNTEVEITPSVLTLSVRPPGVPFTINLNEGQLFQLQAYGDLTGTRIKSVDADKKIAVFSGARTVEISCGATSHVYDQNYPLSSWGTEYILVPFSGQGGDPFRIIASADQTSVYFDGVLKATLNTGQFYEQTVTAPVYVNSSQPTAAIQFSKGGSCTSSSNGDPSMLIQTPLSFTQTEAIFKSVNTFSTPDHFVNIICTSDGVSSMTLDAVNISSAFSILTGNPDYSYAQVSLEEGSHVLQNDRGFSATCYGFGFYNAYTFNTGFGEPEFIGVSTSSDASLAFEVFPNPMRDETYFYLNQLPDHSGENLHLKIYTMQGELILNEPIRESIYHLPRNGIKSGLYFCQLYFLEELIAVKKLLAE